MTVILSLHDHASLKNKKTKKKPFSLTTFSRFRFFFFFLMLSYYFVNDNYMRGFIYFLFTVNPNNIICACMMHVMPTSSFCVDNATFLAKINAIHRYIISLPKIHIYHTIAVITVSFIVLFRILKKCVREYRQVSNRLHVYVNHYLFTPIFHMFIFFGSSNPFFF